MVQPLEKVDRRDAKLALAHLFVAFIALGLGGFAGLLQTLVRSGKFELPGGISYYTILTTHGVLLGLVLTTFFIIGFQFAAVSRTAGAFTDSTRRVGWIGFWLMTIGTAMSAFFILTGQAAVLYTFYAPLQAHAGFYIGLALVVVGSWVSGFAMFAHYARWRKAHRGQASPLLTFMSVTNMALWLICTLGVAATVVFQLIPWSLGLSERVNVLLSKRADAVLVFRASARLLLAVAGVYGLVRRHSESDRGQNVLRFARTVSVYLVLAVFDSGRFPPSIA